MKNLLAYKIISYLLLVVAALLSIICLFALLIALANPLAFIQVIIFASLITYIIASFVFFINVVKAGKPCKPKLIRIIKTTSMVAMVFSVLFLINGIFIIYNPSIITQFVSEFFESQKKQNLQVSFDLMVATMKGVIYFMILFATTLFVHIYETHKLIKQYLNTVNNQNTPL